MDVNKIYSPIDIAVSGLRAQRKHIEVISSNVANARTSDAGQGEPYRRLEAAIRAEHKGISSVTVDEVVEAMGDFQRVFEPGSPLADDEGYVLMPNVSLPIEMMNLSIATRVYQANAAVLKRYQRMVETALELLR
jgi:flagellar basal-body rod protein FlgC